ncbi:uncharacterized protein [Euwallacea fornicatus]|uniref:uncharacterized protein n=1 Tax=Euwallacea fornicatus TaxID=995702 RepID=UPI00338EFD95
MNSKVMLCAILLGFVYTIVVSEVPTCPDTDPSNPVFFDDPDDCGAFYECSNQEAVHFQCSPGTYFDESKDTCEWAENVDCGTRPTTPQPDSTLDPDITTEGAQ